MILIRTLSLLAYFTYILIDIIIYALVSTLWSSGIFWMVGRVVKDPSLGLPSPYEVVPRVLILIITLFRILFGAEAVLPEQIKHQSMCTTVEVPPCPSEAEEKDLLGSERLKVVANLQKYQDETRSWRDPKVNKKDFDVGNLVLL
jgi:hypothetical protein